MMTGRRQTPRAGLSGIWDHLVGPGAATEEQVGAVVCGVAGALLGFLGDREGSGVRHLSRRGVAAMLGADLGGGVWANATPTARWWFHGRGQGPREALLFSAAHLHPFLVAALWRERDWRFAWGNYTYLLAATAAISSSPPQFRLPISLGLTSGAVGLNTVIWKPTPGLAWFAPVFFLKLLVSHAATLPPATVTPQLGSTGDSADRD